MPRARPRFARTARGDAIAPARCLLRMLDDAERQGWATWPDLERQMQSAAKRRKGEKAKKKKVRAGQQHEADRQERLARAAELEGRGDRADR